MTLASLETTFHPGAPWWALLALIVATLVLLWPYLPRLEWRERREGERVPVERWRAAGLGVQPSQGVVAFQVGETCPLCRDAHRPTSEAARCPSCRALFHLQRSLEVDAGRCSTLGCAGVPRRVDAVAA